MNFHNHFFSWMKIIEKINYMWQIDNIRFRMCIFYLVENYRGNRGRSRWRGGGGNRGGGGGSPGPRSRLDSDGDLVMGDEDPRPSRSRLWVSVFKLSCFEWWVLWFINNVTQIDFIISDIFIHPVINPKCICAIRLCALNRILNVLFLKHLAVKLCFVYSSPEPKAHKVGLLVYQWSVVVHILIFNNSEASWPILIKFYV